MGKRKPYAHFRRQTGQTDWRGAKQTGEYTDVCAKQCQLYRQISGSKTTCEQARQKAFLETRAWNADRREMKHVGIYKNVSTKQCKSYMGALGGTLDMLMARGENAAGE